MRLVICICVALASTGCFYVDPINQRPQISLMFGDVTNSAEPRRVTSREFVHRGDLLQFDVEFFDVDSPSADMQFDWKEFYCSDRDPTTCETLPFATQTSPLPVFAVPMDLSGVRAIRINLDLRDDRGALAQTFMLLYINDAPSLDLRSEARSLVIGAPITLRATYGDPDDGPAAAIVTWEVVAPGSTSATLVDLSIPPDIIDLAHTSEAKLLVPDGPGDWDVKVTARDQDNEATEKHLLLGIGPDQPPCLSQWQPVVPPADATLPIADPALFQVVIVEDDLDAYPRQSSDPHFGTTAFEWSILAPGSPGRQRLIGATGNTVDFDPRAFTPGDIVELRVEIFDRNRASIACADAAASCSVNAQPACIQRQTWRVEVR